MNEKLLCFVAMGSVAAFSGCAKDRTIDDYRHDKVNEAAAKVQAISGSYRGAVVIQPGVAPSEALILELQPDLQVNGTMDPVATELQAGVQGKVTLLSAKDRRILSFRGGYYDSTTNEFKAEVEVVQRDGFKGGVEISGKFSGQTFDGHIEASGYPEASIDFQVTKDGPMPESSSLSSVLRGGSTAVDDLSSGSRRYVGTAHYEQDGTDQPMTMTVVSRPVTALDLNFLERFTPIAWVDVTLVTQLGTVVAFSNAQWDPRTKTLISTFHGAGASDRPGYDVSLNCQGDLAHWQCSYLGNVYGLIFTADFTPKTADGGAQ